MATHRPSAAAGAFTVVIEGTLEPVARAITEALAFLVERGIPVMGHVGLQAPSGARPWRLPYRRAARRGEQVMATHRPSAAAGAFTVVIEGTLEPVARAITEAL
ncbi:3-methyl-2-oxobutanoate hydroxymethyltransferase, partial [Bordetella pertussis]